jgi:serine phosphatase RsbU (regulator of sigma subunit)
MKWPWSKKREGGLPGGGRPADDDAMSASTILTGDAEQDSRSLEILLDTIAAVTANIDLDSVLRDIVYRSLQVTSAERALLLLGENPDQLTVRVAQDKEGKSLSGELQWSRSLVRRCLEEGVAVRSVVQSDQEALEIGRSVYDLKLRGDRAEQRQVARLHADSLEKAKLQKDVEIARRIQQHLLPPVPKDWRGLDIGLRYEAAERASGDTYDFVPMAGGRYAIMIGDVTGHGVGAALLTHAVQAALRSYLELIDDAATVITKVNQRLVEGVETGNFMSLLLLIIDPAKRTLEYVNAGHPGLVVCHEDGTQVLEKTGMVLGVVGDQQYEASPLIQLQPGDLLFTHTDGVDESMSPEREVFGVERLHQLVGMLRREGFTADRALAEVERQIRDHVGSDAREDDFTMIAVKLT